MKERKNKDPIDKRLTEVNKLVWRIMIVNATLGSIIIFLLSAVLFRMFNITFTPGYPVYAAIPATIYFIASIAQGSMHRDRMKEQIKILRIIGIKCPSLDEKLQTAYDNREKSNLIVRNLISNVTHGMDCIRCSSFMEGRKICLRVIVVISLSFALLSVTFINLGVSAIHFDGNDLMTQVNEAMYSISGSGHFPGGEGRDWEKGNLSSLEEDERVGEEGGGEEPGFNEGPLPDSGGGAGDAPDSDIWDVPTSAKISGTDINMEMHPEYGGEIEIRDVDGERGTSEFGMSSIESAGIPEREPVEYEEIIKKYFEKLLGETK